MGHPPFVWKREGAPSELGLYDYGEDGLERVELPLEVVGPLLAYLDAADGGRIANRADLGWSCLGLQPDGTCKHYEHRPVICREFEVGKADCRRFRRESGVGKRP
jgi:Fe-S-cluster containining protein